MNNKLPAFFASALILLFSGCESYNSAIDLPPAVTEAAATQSEYIKMEPPDSEDAVPAGMTNKHLARITKTDEKGKTTVTAIYSYDSAGREIARTIGRHTVKREYNAFGDIAFQEDYLDGKLCGYIDYEYDSSRRLTSQSRHFPDGRLIYGEDTFDLEYDSEGRITSKVIHAAEEAGRHLKYDYYVEQSGELTLTIIDTSANAEAQVTVYDSKTMQRPIRITKFAKEDKNILSYEEYQYDADNIIAAFGKAENTEDGSYKVNLYIYNEYESGFPPIDRKANLFNTLEWDYSDYDEDVSSIAVYLDYDGNNFKRIMVYDCFGNLEKEYAFNSSMPDRFLLSCREYDSGYNLVSRTIYTNDESGNILAAKRYMGNELVETITYDYQVIPGAYCKPYTVKQKDIE